MNAHAARRTCPLLGAVLVLAGLFSLGLAGKEQRAQLREGFVDVKEAVPGISIDLRYCTADNFIGQKVDGYDQPRAILTRQAAEALRKVQEELAPYGLGLRIYDAYRPQQAVDHFVRWARDVQDTKTKERYYPNVAKQDLFKEEYIADKSSHTRGSTVDVTLIALDGTALDMGSPFDFFDPRSWPTERGVSREARSNRLLLRNLMLKHGFKPYAREWWHFTLANEPFPDTYFDFPVR